MLTLPPALLDLVEVSPGQQVVVTVQDGRIIVEPQRRPRYALAELLSRCDAKAPRPEEDRTWLEAPAHGKELL